MAVLQMPCKTVRALGDNSITKAIVLRMPEKCIAEIFWNKICYPFIQQNDEIDTIKWGF